MPALTREQTDHLEEFGFVAVENVLDPESIIDPVIEEYKGVLDSLAEKLFNEGKISSTYEELEFGERVTRIYEESGEIHNGYFDFSLPQNGIKADTPFWAGPAVFNALTAPGLLDAVESVVGPEIYSNPVQHVRIKVPESRAPKDDQGRPMFGVTPWHQDSGVINPEADATDILTVWFPLMDASVENGCLQVVPGSHTGQLLTHCPGYKETVGVTIPTDMFAEDAAMPIPLKKGSALFMNKLTVHSSLPNVSDRIRWSFDLRYHPIGQPTGRKVFPGFVARSAENPERELHDPEQWYLMWKETRDALARSEQPKFNRWNTDDPACA